VKLDTPIHLEDELGAVLCSAETKRKIDAARDEVDVNERVGGGKSLAEKLTRRIRALERHAAKVAKERRVSVVDGVPNATCTGCLTKLDRCPQIRNRAANAELERDAALDVVRVA
jgi:hypothetical protein